MIHPDIKKALELVTRHAGRAQAEKAFAHLIPTEHADEHAYENRPPHMETAGKETDERTKANILMEDADHRYPVGHLEPDGDEDMYGHEPPGEEEPDSGDEHVAQLPPMHLGIVTSRGAEPVKGPMPALDPPKKRGRGRPKKVY